MKDSILSYSIRLIPTSLYSIPLFLNSMNDRRLQRLENKKDIDIEARKQVEHERKAREITLF